MNNLYTYVNYTSKSIDNLIQELPENWKNIYGLTFLGDEKIKDLTWAGYPGFGWVKISDFDFSDYTYQPEWLELSKNSIKDLISALRYEAETNALSWNGNILLLDDRTKSAINFKLTSLQNNLNQTFIWKFLNRSLTISGTDLLEISEIIDQYIQDCFSLEDQKRSEIDACNDVSELGQVDLEINWPSTSFTTE